MSDPRRYLDDAEAPAEARSLLRSAANDGLDDARTAAVAQALGIDAAPAISPPAPRSGTRLIAGAAIVGLSALGIFVATRHEPPRPVVASAVAIVAPAAPTPPASDAISVAQLPEAPPVEAAPAIVVPPRTAPSAVAVDDLPAQLRALEDVRRALAEHRITDARAGLTSYDRTFPKKLLGAEARVLDIETLFAEGRTSDAQSKGRSFLVAAPDSPYATRIRSLLAEHP